MTGISRVGGSMLDWPSIEPILPKVHLQSIQQVLELWRRHKDRQGDPILWGDEIEGNFVVFDSDKKVVKPLISASHVIECCLSNTLESPELEGKTYTIPIFVPEGASFNIESMPGQPMGISSLDILNVELNMKRRRALLSQHLNRKQSYLTTTSFPMLGASKPHVTAGGKSQTQVEHSQYIRDDILAPFPRYQALAANIRTRRKRKPAINIPVYRDRETPWPFSDPTVDYSLHLWPEDDDVRNGAVKENCVYLDSFIGGACCCSLQVTMQASNMDQARWLYDQLIPMGPIMLALTAATPIFKGYLTGVDVRWPQFAMASDERTAEEQDRGSKTRISKSRASSSSVYLSHDKRLTSDQQDQDLNIDPNAKAKLLAGGMDDKLATHFAHLFIRDPLTVQVDEIDARHEDKTCHFDTIQSSVWQTVRFKPPPWIANQEIGWRVEFRSMEIQLTDFENAAFAVFMILLSQTLLHFNISLYIPIPEVDKNMGQAFTHNAVISERFSFVTAPAIGRKKSTSEGSHASSNEWGQPETTTTSRSPDSTNSDAALMTIDEIVNGSAFKCTGFIGLIPLIRKYIQQTQNFNSECVTKINGYLHLVSSRARGTTWTSAKWQRDFVRSHPQYRKDSVVVDEIAYDMLRAQEEISKSNGKVVTGKKMFVEEHVLSSLSEKDKLMDL